MPCVHIYASVAMILFLFPPDSMCEAQGLKMSQEMLGRQGVWEDRRSRRMSLTVPEPAPLICASSHVHIKPQTPVPA